jgi:hypothetical protein
MATTNLVNGPWVEMSHGITGNDQVTVTNDLSEAQKFFRVTAEME